jgi:hypothetical protein
LSERKSGRPVGATRSDPFGIDEDPTGDQGVRSFGASCKGATLTRQLAVAVRRSVRGGPTALLDRSTRCARFTSARPGRRAHRRRGPHWHGPLCQRQHRGGRDGRGWCSARPRPGQPAPDERRRQRRTTRSAIGRGSVRSERDGRLCRRTPPAATCPGLPRTELHLRLWTAPLVVPPYPLAPRGGLSLSTVNLGGCATAEALAVLDCSALAVGSSVVAHPVGSAASLRRCVVAIVDEHRQSLLYRLCAFYQECAICTPHTRRHLRTRSQSPSKPLQDVAPGDLPRC